MSINLARVDAFCRRFGLKIPILLGPMAGASAPSLSKAVMEAGGLGACGALLMRPEEIRAWAEDVQAGAQGPFQINLWCPDPPPRRDRSHEARMREFLGNWGPPPAENAGDAMPRILPPNARRCWRSGPRSYPR